MRHWPVKTTASDLSFEHLEKDLFADPRSKLEVIVDKVNRLLHVKAPCELLSAWIPLFTRTAQLCRLHGQSNESSTKERERERECL